jgi:hypothetical protein
VPRFVRFGDPIRTLTRWRGGYNLTHGQKKHGAKVSGIEGYGKQQKEVKEAIFPGSYATLGFYHSVCVTSAVASDSALLSMLTNNE